MIRKDEALLSQSNMSLKKVIYVEGNFDYKILTKYLKYRRIKSIKIIEINIEVDDTHLPIENRKLAKEKVIGLIDKANKDKNIDKKYLGLVDQDYDYFNQGLLNMENLFYTEYNSLESIFLNFDLINDFLGDYDVSIDLKEFSTLLSNAQLLSCYFLFQISSINSISSTDAINFGNLKVCNRQFCCENTQKILLRNILQCKAKNKDNLIERFVQFLKFFDRKLIYQNQLIILHGKMTLKYIICILKRKFADIQKLDFDTILIMLADKFYLNGFYVNSKMFDVINDFSQ